MIEWTQLSGISHCSCYYCHFSVCGGGAPETELSHTRMQAHRLGSTSTFTALESPRLWPNSRRDPWPRRCLASDLTIIITTIKKENSKKITIRGFRTDPEVDGVEARTGCEAGAPVCSARLLCSLSNELRIGRRRRCRRRVSGPTQEQEMENGVRLLPFSFQSLLPILTLFSLLLSVQTSDDPLIPIGLSPSLPPPRSAPCHISPLQQNEATPPPPAAACDVWSVGTLGTRPSDASTEVLRRGRQRPLYLLERSRLPGIYPRNENENMFFEWKS